jgi:hypothetical protein
LLKRRSETVLRTKPLITVAVAVALLGGWAPPADAASVSKREARRYLLRHVPPAAPRVLLRDERSGFFRTARLSVEPARRCRRRSAAAVSCRFRARLVPDAAHRKRNWWPISCRGAVLVRRRRDGRLQGYQRDYVCRTVRP